MCCCCFVCARGIVRCLMFRVFVVAINSIVKQVSHLCPIVLISAQLVFISASLVFISVQ